jgi:hypothetical protein
LAVEIVACLAGIDELDLIVVLVVVLALAFPFLVIKPS